MQEILFRNNSILDGLLNGETSYLQAYFTQFIVCTENYFYDLIDDIKETIEKANFSTCTNQNMAITQPASIRSRDIQTSAGIRHSS